MQTTYIADNVNPPECKANKNSMNQVRNVKDQVGQGQGQELDSYSKFCGNNLNICFKY